MLDVRTVDSELEMSGALDDEGGRELLRVIATMPGDVRIDASGVQRVDGAGLTALAIARQQCLADGRSFVLTSIAPEAVRGLRVADQLAELFGARQASVGGATLDTDGVDTDATLHTDTHHDARDADRAEFAQHADHDESSRRDAGSRRFRLHFHRHRHHGM
jgi:anti-anti-sigma regulatory factor